MRWFLILALTLSLTVVSWGHDPQLTGLKLIYDKSGVTFSVVTHASKLGKGLSKGDADKAIRQRLKVRLDGKEFAPKQSQVIKDPANDVVMWQARHEGLDSRIEVLSRLYPEDAQSKLVVTVFRNGRLVQEALLDATHTSIVISANAQAAALNGGIGAGERSDGRAVVGRFLKEGVLHIFGGLDHVLFVLGLLMLGGSLRQLLKTVTAFTLAHSITLSLAATGIYVPSPRVVEPLIALSIIAVAFENLRAKNSRSQKEPDEKIATDWRPWIAFAFGLIHGFGFAGALAEVGLPREALGWALLAFNVGVESGQAMIVLVAAPLLAYMMKTQVTLHRYVVVAGSYGIALSGAFWFVQRLVSV